MRAECVRMQRVRVPGARDRPRLLPRGRRDGAFAADLLDPCRGLHRPTTGGAALRTCVVNFVTGRGGMGPDIFSLA